MSYEPLFLANPYHAINPCSKTATTPTPVNPSHILILFGESIMTENEFDNYINTEDGQSRYYDWLQNKCPELSKVALNTAFFGGMYIEDFMNEVGVVFDDGENHA